MQPLRRNINPFALMIDPQAVFAQIESSERLERLHRRVCRPLDKPLLGGAAEADDEAAAAGADDTADLSDSDAVAANVTGDAPRIAD
jgi:hypothetical protein